MDSACMQPHRECDFCYERRLERQYNFFVLIAHCLDCRASLAMTDKMFAIVKVKNDNRSDRHCEEQSDEATHTHFYGVTFLA
jgi:hypothetical protein